VSGDEEYRFQPEDFDGEGDSEPTVDRAPLVIVGSLGVGIGLFLANPFVDPVTVSGAELGLGGLAAVVVSLGLLVGGLSYASQGRIRLGVVHAVGGLGWLSVVVGATLSSAVALAVGGGALVAGAGALLFLTWRSWV
jgi:hypothetical protein